VSSRPFFPGGSGCLQGLGWVSGFFTYLLLETTGQSKGIAVYPVKDLVMESKPVKSRIV
jgi:hypothetical protein